MKRKMSNVTECLVAFCLNRSSVLVSSGKPQVALDGARAPSPTPGADTFSGRKSSRSFDGGAIAR